MSYPEPFRTLIKAAILAPSGDNTQSGEFEADKQGATITVFLDETRDRSPMNAGQQMARIACGAAIENIVQTAHHNGLKAQVEYFDDPLQVATVRIEGYSGAGVIIPDCIADRHTNRHLYDGRSLTGEEITRLQNYLPNEGGIEVDWISDRQELLGIANAVGRADALMFGQPEYLLAFLSKVRFDLPPNVAADEGLPVGSLEVSAFERLLLPLLRFAPTFLISSPMMRATYKKNAERLINSASGVVLVNSPDTGNKATALVGRLMQRIWLYLTDTGYVVQPMMSIPVLANAARINSRGPTVQIPRGYAPAVILRFGYGPPATARTGRLSR